MVGLPARGRPTRPPRHKTGVAVAMETIVGDLSERYVVEDKKGEGTFSEVMICERRSDGIKFAVKRMKANFSR